MRFKILPLSLLILSCILSMLALSYLSIGDGYVQAPMLWLYYLIWSLPVAGLMSFWICSHFLVSWHYLIAGIIQLVLTLFLHALLLSAIPHPFITTAGDYYQRLVFRPMAHVIRAPFISVTVLQYEPESKTNRVCQSVRFWGNLGWATIAQGDERVYHGDPKLDPTTLEYALAQGNQAEFTHKFIAMLDSRFDSETGQRLRPLDIQRHEIASPIRQLLPEQPTYDAIDLMIAFKELPLLDKMSGAISSKDKWLTGAIYLDLSDEQLYRYYRLAKDHGQTRLVDDRYSFTTYGTDYLLWALYYHDMELVTDITGGRNQPAPVYLLAAIEQLLAAEKESKYNQTDLDIIQKLVDVVPFGDFKAKLTGEKRIDFISRSKIDVGLAMRFNGVSLVKKYNTLLKTLQTEQPAVYDLLSKKGYQAI